MTKEQKEKLEHWLTHNLQLTSKSNVELIVKHVEHYYCPDTAAMEQYAQQEVAKVKEDMEIKLQKNYEKGYSDGYADGYCEERD